jgi:MFS family permease
MPHKNKEPFPLKFMLPIVLGTMMNPLNSTMLATALIPLCNSFGKSVGEGAILVTSLYVTSTIAQPLMGRLADIFSAKKINTFGLILVLNRDVCTRVFVADRVQDYSWFGHVCSIPFCYGITK